MVEAEVKHDPAVSKVLIDLNSDVVHNNHYLLERKH